ncbi:oxalate/formate MFS antiporter [Methylobacterium sp. Leaf399]|nr:MULTISPECIES: oxalate/formate MFS antiporter [unclassified Methylobacterium]KQP50789.1 oxalate/formate MFS antiporter [Methylobacterium sp. Leaf108]KQT07769.1 oxalate/formate MFS antiporter [Methylobacterium sp. Leaf399]KQT82111.1 oxalate/formate MFS antiporter [Methylobacterium sp. Leaf466]
MALSSAAPVAAKTSSNRWLQLILGVACMVAAANIQYAWTLFVPEIQKTFGWDRAAIQVAFTIFVIVQTWLTPIEGYFIDKYGPSRVVMFGGLMTGLAWVINSYATTLSGFYFGSVVGGIGVGCVYATCINNALKWFPDKRGLAVGLTAGGYGAGSALTIIPIANMISQGSYAQAFFVFGLIQGAIIILASIGLRGPGKGEVVYSSKVLQSRRDYTLGEALRTPVFYVMLLMFTCTVTGGLMAVAQLGVIAQDLGVKEFKVDLYFFAMAALPFALMLDRILNGISRPLFGFISDRIGREKTMFIAFTMEGIGIVALGYFGSNPWAFIILSGIVFLAWGEVYSLFSATAADTFGSAHIGKIYGVLYCAKGVAALFVPLGNILMQATGTWATVLYTVAAMDLLAAFLAIAVLRPMLKRHHAANGSVMPAANLAHA